VSPHCVPLPAAVEDEQRTGYVSAREHVATEKTPAPVNVLDPGVDHVMSTGPPVVAICCEIWNVTTQLEPLEGGIVAVHDPTAWAHAWVHTPATQDAPLVHVCPQVPQLFVSVCKSVQVASHAASPAGQAHTPA
jgi:hypothetical protein